MQYLEVANDSISIALSSLCVSTRVRINHDDLGELALFHNIQNHKQTDFIVDTV